MLFKTLDGSNLHEPNKLECTTVRVGDEISISIPKSLTTCKPRVAVVKCSEKDINCIPLATPTTMLGCVYSQDNDEKASANIVVKNKLIVPAFILGYSVIDEDGITDNAEIFEYEGGGTFDSLIEYIESTEFGYEITSYGLKIFVSSKYAGETIYLSSDNTIFLIGKTYCLNNASEYGLSYCLPTVGCWQILLYKVVDGIDTVMAYSGTISAVDFSPVRTSIVEWHDGLYHRERLPIWTENSEISIEEKEEVLSTGKISITDVIIRAQTSMYVDVLPLNEHKKLLSLLKKGVKINGRQAKLRGEYSLVQVGKNYMASGTLNFENEDIIDINNCEGDSCSSGSSLVFDYV